MGSNGRKYMEENMPLEKNVIMYEMIIHTLVGNKVFNTFVLSNDADQKGNDDRHEN
jgi:hypothetical protein